MYIYKKKKKCKYHINDKQKKIELRYNLPNFELK